MADVLNFRPHPDQERFLNRPAESGLFPGAQPAACETSTPNRTCSSTREPRRHKGFQSTAVDVEVDRALLTMDEPPKNSMVFMTRLISMACSACGHDWQQPAAKGRCPRCHSESTQTTEARVCHAAKV